MIFILLLSLLANATTVTTGEQEFCKSVVGNTTSTQDFTPPNGATINFSQFGGTGPTSAGGNNGGSSVTINWDPVGTNTLLFVTYGQTQQDTTQSVTGDGTKVVRISLQNSGLLSANICGHFIYQQVQ